jgi:hypothetical protein
MTAPVEFLVALQRGAVSVAQRPGRYTHCKLTGSGVEFSMDSAMNYPRLEARVHITKGNGRRHEGEARIALIGGAGLG